MKQRELWSARKFSEVAAELCEYAIDHFRYTRKDGAKKGFFWQDRRGVENQKQAAYAEALAAVSHTIACLAAQHLEGGHAGVGTDEPFQGLQMWKEMTEGQRRKLALKFAKGFEKSRKLLSDWTVLLLYPDYIGDYGQETYLARVQAQNAEQAQLLAQKEAHDANRQCCNDPDDFAVLAAFEGSLSDWKII